MAHVRVERIEAAIDADIRIPTMILALTNSARPQFDGVSRPDVTVQLPARYSLDQFCNGLRTNARGPASISCLLLSQFDPRPLFFHPMLHWTFFAMDPACDPKSTYVAGCAPEIRQLLGLQELFVKEISSITVQNGPFPVARFPLPFSILGSIWQVGVWPPPFHRRPR
jgi:hypothetical protein